MRPFVPTDPPDGLPVERPVGGTDCEHGGVDVDCTLDVQGRMVARRRQGAGAGTLIGYARVSTRGQDLTAQREALLGLGVALDRVYVDHGLAGTNRDRTGLREALAAVREGDRLVVTKLDRLARSVPDARDIVGELTDRGVSLQIAGSVHDPSDPVGRLLFNVLAMVAEFEADLISARTREGLAVAKAKGRLKGGGRSCL